SGSTRQLKQRGKFKLRSIVFSLIMAESRKKRRTFLSVQHKNAIVEELNKGISVKYLARQYGVSRDVIHSICRENEHLTGLGKRGGHSSKHKSRRRSSNEVVEDRLYRWIQNQQAVGKELTDPLIQEKAIELCGEQEGSSLTGDKGWLAEFKIRYKVGPVRVRRTETTTREETEERLTDVSNENYNEEEIDEYGIYDEDPVRRLDEDESIRENEQEEDINDETREEEDINDETREEEDENEAAEADKSQLSLIARRRTDLNMLREIIKKYAYNNQAVLIMGEAIINILHNNII
ncbi:jerky protein homolog-like, partial [Bombus flavifrons]|uniref:jerky protein homolog-like n=1 Tax=Bombus flavifrons TaxID=103934 RepID=UPI0037042276